MSEFELAPSRLQQLAQASEHLKALDDQVGIAFQKLAEAIAGLRLGIPLSIDDSDPEHPNQVETTFEFSRAGKQWQFFQRVYDPVDGRVLEETPITGLPRDERVRLLRRVPELLDGAMGEIDRRCQQRAEALAAADKLRRELAGAEGTK